MNGLSTSGYRVFLLVCVCVDLASAQVLEPGQRLRVATDSLPGDPVVGELLRVGEDSLVLLHGGSPLTLSRSSISEIEVATGTHRHTLRGALVGSLAVGVALGQDMLRKPGQCSGSGNYGQLCALFLTGAMAGGAALGAVIGAAIRHDDWSRVSFDGVHAGIVKSAHRRRTILLAISFRPLRW